MIPVMIIFQSCSYIDTMKRAKYNEEIKGTDAYYDEKCLVAEECAQVSAKIILPDASTLDALAIAIVVEDGNESRVIDLEVVNFTQENEQKVSFFFFDLPVGSYTAYALTIPEQNATHDDFNVLGKFNGTITKDDLKAYQNAIILDDIMIDIEESSEHFAYSLEHMQSKLILSNEKRMGHFSGDVSLDDPVFSHKMATEGLYYPESFRKKTKGMYRLASEYHEGTIPVIFVHGMGGTPRDWKYMLENLDLTLYTPYVVYYPSGEDFSKLAAQFNAWILSDKIFEQVAGVIIAHSFGGVIVRDASNLQPESQKRNSGLFISLATPYGGDAKASEGVKNAPYVIPSWRSIADKGDFIQSLYRKELSDHVAFEMIFAYNNAEEGPSGDGRVPLDKQLRREAQNEARSIRGFNEDHISILRSKETVDYINTLLEAFAQENIKK